MAVAEHGYGISYLFPSDHRIFFHITSRHSSPETDTSRFGKLLYDSLDEIKALFDEEAEEEEAAKESDKQGLSEEKPKSA